MFRAGEPSVILIRPAQGWGALNLRDLWAYRDLLYFLVWRDIKVRLCRIIRFAVERGKEIKDRFTRREVETREGIDA